LAVVERLQAQMVQIQFLDQSHQLVVEALLAVGQTTEILEAPVVVEVEVHRDLPVWVVLELLIKDIKAVTGKLITQPIELVAGVVALEQRLLTYLQTHQPQVVLA
jgi:hypothetical protein